MTSGSTWVAGLVSAGIGPVFVVLCLIMIFPAIPIGQVVGAGLIMYLFVMFFMVAML